MATRTWRGNTYRFTVTAANATAGATYTNNGQTFTVTDTITGGTILYATGTGAPLASGTLTKASGTGDATITYSSNTAPSVNYNVATNWLENAVPTNADDVVTGVFAGNMTITAAAAALTVDFTGYTGTCTINTSQTWTVGANGGAIVFKLATGMTLAGTGTLTISNTTGNTSTITSAGKTVPWTVLFGNSNLSHTIALADNWTITGTVSSNGIGATKTISGNTIFAQGGINFVNTQGYSGSTILEASGSSNQSVLTGAIIPLFFRINKTGGTFTFGNVFLTCTTFDWIQGAVAVTAGTTARIYTSTYNCTANITWQNVQIGASAGTFSPTFTSAFIIAGTLNSFSGPNTINITGAAFMSINAMTVPASSGNITYNIDTSLTVLGTLTISSTGNLILSGIIYLQGNLALSSSGGITSTGTLEMNGTSKTITSTTGSTISCNFTINSASITLSGGSTLRINNGSNAFKLNFSLLGSGVVAITGNSRIDGGGNSVEYFWVISAGVTVTFVSGLTVNTQFQSLAGTAASRVTFVSSSGGVQRKFTLLNNGIASQSVLFTNATDIDSGDGQTIWTFGTPVATLTNTINWNPLTPGGYNESGFIY